MFMEIKNPKAWETSFGLSLYRANWVIWDVALDSIVPKCKNLICYLCKADMQFYQLYLLELNWPLYSQLLPKNTNWSGPSPEKNTFL